jgi:hypothetical protein
MLADCIRLTEIAHYVRMGQARDVCDWSISCKMTGHAGAALREVSMEDLISAEVVPAPNRVSDAARALERLGLRVLHIGPTISVRGPAAVWASTFNVSFERRTKPRMREVEGGEVSYLEARTEQMQIPPELHDVVREVMFAEPPEFFSTG